MQTPSEQFQEELTDDTRTTPQTGAKGRMKGTDIDCGGWEDLHRQTEKKEATVGCLMRCDRKRSERERMEQLLGEGLANGHHKADLAARSESGGGRG